MFILGHIFIGLSKLIGMIFSIFYFLLIIRIIMSWINPDPYNEFVRMIYRITDIILVPIRRVLPLRIGMFDFSPIIAFLLIYFLNYVLVNVLFGIGQRLL